MKWLCVLIDLVKEAILLAYALLTCIELATTMSLVQRPTQKCRAALEPQ